MLQYCSGPSYFTSLVILLDIVIAYLDNPTWSHDESLWDYYLNLILALPLHSDRLPGREIYYRILNQFPNSWLLFSTMFRISNKFSGEPIILQNHDEKDCVFYPFLVFFCKALIAQDFFYSCQPEKSIKYLCSVLECPAQSALFNSADISSEETNMNTTSVSSLLGFLGIDYNNFDFKSVNEDENEIFYASILISIIEGDEIRNDNYSVFRLTGLDKMAREAMLHDTHDIPLFCPSKTWYYTIFAHIYVCVF